MFPYLLNPRQIKLLMSSDHDTVLWRFLDLAISIQGLIGPSSLHRTVSSKKARKLVRPVMSAYGILMACSMALVKLPIEASIGRWFHVESGFASCAGQHHRISLGFCVCNGYTCLSFP